MHFKSGKFWSSTFSKVLSGAALSAVALVPVLSSATITVTPVTSAVTSLSNFFNNTYYYPAFSSGIDGSTGTVVGQFGVIDTLNGFNFVDLAADSIPTNGYGGGNPGVVYFNVISSNTSFPNPAAIGVYTGGTQAGTATQLLPISSYQQNMCGNGDNGNCLAGFIRGGLSGNNYFYGVNYLAGQTVTIGIDVQAACRSFRAGGADVPPICNSQMINGTATVTATTPFLINFAIFNAQDIINLGNGLATTPVPATQDTPVQASLIFNTLSGAPITPAPSPVPSPTPTPTAICNLGDGVATPEDSGIQIDSTRFSVAGEPGVTGPGAIIAVANLSLDNNLADSTVNDQAAMNGQGINYTNGNSVPTGYFVPGNLFVFGGLQDSSPPPGQTFNYRIGFLVRDYSGFVFDDHSGGDTGTCTFPDFYNTSQIQGFLNANKCFIATAAFRMGNDGPIRLLREFRDQFLEKFGLGQSFVHWYYGWSPDAADWLIDHPVFRFPVLLALIPLQLIAWMILHPMVLGLLALLTFALGAGLYLRGFVSRPSKEGAL